MNRNDGSDCLTGAQVDGSAGLFVASVPGARAERKTLYVTARTGLYAIEMSVAAAFGPEGPVEPTATPAAPSTPTTLPSPSSQPPSVTPTPNGIGDWWLYFPRLERLVDKMIFGSDYPGVPSISGNIAALREVLGPTVARRVLWENGARLLGLQE